MSLVRYAMLPCRSSTTISSPTPATTILITQLTPDAAADLRRLSEMRQSIQGNKGTWHMDAAPLNLRCWTVAPSAAMRDDHASMREVASVVVAPIISMPRLTKLFETLMSGPGVVVDEAGAMRAYLNSWGAKQIAEPERIMLALTADGVKFTVGDSVTTRWSLDALLGPPST